MKVIFRSTRPAWTKRQYNALLVVLWIYTFVWLSALIAINFLLPLNGIAKAVITLVLVVVTPTDGHFMSYEKYRRWHAEHVVVVPREGSE